MIETRKEQTRTERRWLMVTLLMVTVLLALPAAGVEKEVRKSFDVSPGGLLELETDHGAIEVRTHSDARIDVLLLMEARGDREHARERFDDFSVSFERGGNGLRIEGEDRGRGKGLFGFLSGSNELRVKWVVTVPQQYGLDLATAGGSISVRDLNGAIEARTSGGSLEFGRVDGTVRARTSGGSIRIAETGGDVDVSTSGGGISIDRARGNVRAHTSGGSIQVEEVFGAIEAVTSGGSISASISSQPASDCRLSTSGGSVVVRLAPSIALDLDARSSGGRVKAEMPVTVQGTIDKNRLEGTINGGGPALVLRTSGGGISILSN